MILVGKVFLGSNWRMVVALLAGTDVAVLWLTQIEPTGTISAIILC
jgi:hypothetical protein